MPPPVLTHLEGRIPVYAHDHVAVIYRGRAGAFRHAAFLAEGLKRGDLCHYLGPQEFHAGFLQRLHELGIGSDSSLQTRSLRLHTGLADFKALRAYTHEVFTEAEQLHMPAVRWLEEGSWPKAAGFPAPQFFEFHAILNYQVKHYPSAALCQYALDQLEPDHLFSAIATHRSLLIDDTLVRDNPFYIPAEQFVPRSTEERHRDLTNIFREVGFDVSKLLEAVAGFGRLQSGTRQSP